MPYRFLEEEATSDVAFEATGEDLSRVFRSAGDALMNVMVDNIDAIQTREKRLIEIDNRDLDLLLLDVLQALVYYKDAEQLLLRITQADIKKAKNVWHVKATAKGEYLDRERHHLLVDVKAVTLHDFRLEQAENGWKAHVILDI